MMWQVAGIGLGVGAGLAWGWAAGRMFGRPLVQDIAAVAIATLLGCVAVVSAQIARLLTSDTGGLGAVSAGVSESALMCVPAMILLALAAQMVRPRLGNDAVVPVVLGGLGALVGAVLVASTIRVSSPESGS